MPFRNVLAALGVAMFAFTASAQGVAACGSNTYTIDNGGRLTFTLPSNMSQSYSLINYHKGASQGFDIRGGAITIPSGEGEIQAAGAIVLNSTLGTGDTLELRQLTMEYFGNAPFVTALVTYTPNGGLPQHNGRRPVFQVVRSSNSRIPDPCAPSADIMQSFTIAMDQNFVDDYAGGGFAWNAKPKDSYGSLLYQYGADQELAPTKAAN